MRDLQQALVTVVAVGLVACAPPQLVTQDVAFLVPLGDARSTLPASLVLPRSAFDELHHPLTVVDEPDDLYRALAAVSVRLDACFQEGATPGPCQPQVRLVLQPVFDEAGGPTTRDAAVHVFFSATERQVLELARALATARTQRGLAVPAAVEAGHPGFADAAWRRALEEKLLPLLDPARLVRVTSMSVHASNQAWIFGGTDYVDGQAVRVGIPTLGAPDAHVTSTGGTTALEVTIDPGSSVEAPLMPVIAPGGLARASPAELAAAARSVQRLEDPAVHNPATVDCATCHVAAIAQHAFVRQGVAIDASVPAGDAFADTRNLRAFGYFFRLPAVSPRVQREITLVRDDLTRRLEP